MVDILSEDREWLLYAESRDEEVEEAKTTLHNVYVNIKANAQCTSASFFLH